MTREHLDVRLRWRAMASVLVVCCALAGVASAQRPGPPLHWGPATHVGQRGISALSCPSTALCVAGSADGLLVSTDPRRWRERVETRVHTAGIGPSGPAGDKRLVSVRINVRRRHTQR